MYACVATKVLATVSLIAFACFSQQWFFVRSTFQSVGSRLSCLSCELPGENKHNVSQLYIVFSTLLFTCSVVSRMCVLFTTPNNSMDECVFSTHLINHRALENLKHPIVLLEIICISCNYVHRIAHVSLDRSMSIDVVCAKISSYLRSSLQKKPRVLGGWQLSCEYSSGSLFYV